MTSLQLPALSANAVPQPKQTSLRPLRNRWHYGRSYVVVAAIAPLVMLSLLLVHLYTLSQQWISGLRLLVSAERLRP